MHGGLVNSELQYIGAGVVARWAGELLVLQYIGEGVLAWWAGELVLQYIEAGGVLARSGCRR